MAVGSQCRKPTHCGRSDANDACWAIGIDRPHACELSRFLKRLTGVAGCSYEPTVVRPIANDQPIDLIFDLFTALTNDGDQRHVVGDALLDKSGK